MVKKNSKIMNRQEATEIYRKLKQDMDPTAKLLNSSEASVSRSRLNVDKLAGNLARPSAMKKPARFNLRFRGQPAAIALVVVFASMKVALSAMEYMGIATVLPAEASVTSSSQVNMSSNQAYQSRPVGSVTQLTPEDIQVLKQLDSRRVELESQRTKLAEYESDLTNRERELTIKMNELKSLTERLKAAREHTDRKRDGQTEQLAKVYSAMAPEEAARLLEQLDISIALSLISRMPEKRIGQILALISKDRALMLTRMLSGEGTAE